MVSIIVATWNEERIIRAALEQTLALRGKCELIVADGGSSDGTREIVASLKPRVSLVEVAGVGPRGKALNFNAGAHAARGDTLVFLHCDVTLPVDALHRIEEAMRDPRVVGGGFSAVYADSHWLLRLSALKMNLRARFRRVFSGDQAVFVRRDVFQKVGGFAPIPLMDDYEFIGRLRRIGALRCIGSPVRIDPRRHMANGVLKTLVATEVIKLLYRFGVDPARLAAAYRRVLPADR